MKNSPAPAVLKAVLPAVILFSAALSFSFFTPLYGAQAAQSLEDMAYADGAVELPAPVEPPAPTSVTVYTAAPGFNIYFLSVGQGDSIYMELPDGQNALIDGGPSWSATGSLATFLSGKNVTKIDHVVLTHPHADHHKGLKYVFNNLTVGNFYDTRMDNAGATGDNTLRDQINTLGVKVTYPAPGDELSWGPGGVGVKVFNSCPEPVQSSNSRAINNCSIMLKLTYQNASVLFTGDTEADTEASLVTRYGSELKANVLKVAHHGSPNSSSELFLNAVRPARAYIEVGKNNYGHPAQSVLERLIAVGASVYRSDLDGTQEYSVGNLLPPQLAAALY